MSFFGVTKERIEEVRDHPNADRLELIKLKNLNFQFAVRKGDWSVDEECLYFPVDSLIPEDVMLKLGLAYFDENKKLIKNLTGPNKDRVKTIRLRKEISQGIIGKIDVLLEDYKGDDNPENITDFLGVVKYEPPIVFDKNANLLPLPWGLSVYDIEGAERFEKVVNLLMNLPVVVTEKLEGMNSSFFAHKDGTFKINQRRYSISPREGSVHSFWEVAHRSDLLKKAQSICQQLNAEYVGLYGEFLGPNILKNIYHLKNHEVFVFDIMVDGKFIDYNQFKILCKEYKINTVPILEEGKKLKDILNDRNIQEYSNGYSKLFRTSREGIVIRPIKEKYSDEIGGRLQIKQRSPLYLANTDN